MVAKKTRRHIVLPPAGVLNAVQYETGLTVCVGGRNMPVHHISCVLAEPTSAVLMNVPARISSEIAIVSKKGTFDHQR